MILPNAILTPKVHMLLLHRLKPNMTLKHSANYPTFSSYKYNLDILRIKTNYAIYKTL